MKKILSVGALLGSVTTILCCFLPAAFAVLGFGAVFAAFVGAFPQVVWVSEHKGIVFTVAALLLILAGAAQYKARNTACPLDPVLAEGCSTARSWSKRVLVAAALLYGIGFTFAILLPQILS